MIEVGHAAVLQADLSLTNPQNVIERRRRKAQYLHRHISSRQVYPSSVATEPYLAFVTRFRRVRDVILRAVTGLLPFMKNFRFRRRLGRR
jgi:hypothetical protein